MKNNSEYKEQRKYWLRKLISELKNKKGRGTQLITLYIPPERRVSDIINYLRGEYSTAENIKSDTTRKNVQAAIHRIIERLKHYKKIPENGLVVFCGAIPKSGPGTEKMEIYIIEPPEPINVSLYRCDDHFHTEFLEDTLREKEVFGLISIDINEAAIGVLEGRRLSILGRYTSGIPGKHRAGGQSARRFERLREQEIHHYFDRISRHANEFFLDEDIFRRLSGILIGGPGFTKRDFIEESDIDYRLKKKIIGYIDTNYAGEEGLREMVNRSKDLLKSVRMIREKNLVNEFLKRISKNNNTVLYGIKDIISNIGNGIIDTILILDDVSDIYLEYICNSCSYSEYMVLNAKKYDKIIRDKVKCPKCGAIMDIKEEYNIVDYLYIKAPDLGFKVELIDPRSEHGEIIKKFGGVAALLRYEIW